LELTLKQLQNNKRRAEVRVDTNRYLLARERAKGEAKAYAVALKLVEGLARVR
jgi:hypothetical protein